MITVLEAFFPLLTENTIHFDEFFLVYIVCMLNSYLYKWYAIKKQVQEVKF